MHDVVLYQLCSDVLSRVAVANYQHTTTTIRTRVLKVVRVQYVACQQT